ncbi:MAG TPA: DUF2085 domain-containing protein [Candidatus Limnocylindrales bacterium]
MTLKTLLVDPSAGRKIWAYPNVYDQYRERFQGHRRRLAAYRQSPPRLFVLLCIVMVDCAVGPFVALLARVASRAPRLLVYNVITGGLFVPLFWLSGCHRDRTKSFSWRTRTFFVCARCTGILLGYAAFLVLFVTGLAQANLALGILLNVPAYIDGTVQALGIRQSNNKRRLVTGLLSGTGQVMAYNWFFLIGLQIARRSLGVSA